jgi:hypothetical protein
LLGDLRFAQVGRNPGRNFAEQPPLERFGLVTEDNAGQVEFFVVFMSECPAFVMTAIALEPAAASFVIAVCRRS